MRIIEPSANIITKYDNDILKKIELCGRVCYKSEDRITDTSCTKFVDNVLKRGHESVIEHASLVFRVSRKMFEDAVSKKSLYEITTGTLCRMNMTAVNDRFIISANVRTFRELLQSNFTPYFLINAAYCHVTDDEKEILLKGSEGKIDMKEYNRICDNNPDYWTMKISKQDLTFCIEKLAHAYYTVKFIVDRGISHEIVRHRTASFSQESTRYVNYTSGRYGTEITVIKPLFYKEGTINYNLWKESCEAAEKAYFKLMIPNEDGNSSIPQEARTILPNSLKTELYMSANLGEWVHFLKLRCADTAHPQIREVAIPLRDQFREIYTDLEF